MEIKVRVEQPKVISLKIKEVVAGGVSTKDATATPDDLLVGKTAYSYDGKIEGNIETYEGDIYGETQILDTLEVYVNGIYNVMQYGIVNVQIPSDAKEEIQISVVPTKSTQFLVPEDGKVYNKVIVEAIPKEYIIPSGNIDIVDTSEYDVTQYAKAQIKDENLKAENIAENVEVLGIKGTFRGGIDTSDATATANDMLLGKTAYVNDTKVEGTIETYDYSNSEEVSPEIDKFLQGQVTEYYNDRITILSNHFFYGNSKIVSVSFPNVETVRTLAFGATSSLKNVNLPKATKLENAVFQQSSGIETIYLPSATNIGVGCFTNCTKLTTVRLDSVTYISAQAFSACTKLKTLILDVDRVPALQNANAFYNVTNLIIYVRENMIDSFKSASNWSALTFEYKPISEYEEVE